MQNLFVKLLVLGSVIGGSCFVVWQAHNGLTKAAAKVNPDQFVSLPQDSKQVRTDKPSDAVLDWDRPLEFDQPASEPKPTLAAKATASESEADPTPTLVAAKAAPAQADEKQLDESEFPLFFRDDRQAKTQGRPASAAQGEKDLAAASAPAALPDQSESNSESLPPGQNEPEAEAVVKTEMAATEFTDLPGQNVEKPELPAAESMDLPGTEPVPTLAAAASPAQSEINELNGLQAFSRNAAPAKEPMVLPELPNASAISENKTNDREMPGLTKLPPSHPGPVLLPIGTSESPTQSETPDRGMVINADGVKTESETIQKASDTQLPAAPRAFRGEPSIAHGMPADLPQAAATPKPAARELPGNGGDPFAIDPFGLPAAKPAATPAAVPATQRQPAVLPEIVPMSKPENAGGFPAQRDEMPVIKRTSAEQPVATMPPLPPTGEVLPDILPNPQATPELPPATRTPAPTMNKENSDVLPFPEAPTSIPEPVPTTAPKAIEQPGGTSPVMPLPAARPAAEPRMNIEAVPANSPEVLPDFGLAPPPAASQNPTPAPASNPVPQPAAIPAVLPSESMPASPLIGTAEFDTKAPQGPQSPELKIEKIAPPEAEVGEPVIYAIIIRNVGGSEAKDVVVEDRIPRGAQLEGTIPQAYLNEGKLSWQLGSIESGGERKIQLKVVPIEAGQIGSVATVSFASTVSASIKVTAPKLSIDMKGPMEATLGEPLNYQFTLRNEGQGIAKNVYLRAVLPVGMKHPGGNDLEYECGSLPPGGEKVVDLVMQSEQPGTFTILAQANNDGKTHAETRSDVSVIKSRIELSRTGPENRFVGRPANYMLKIANTSSEVLKAITIQEKLAPGVELAAMPTGGRWDPRTRTLTWKMDQLGAGEAREISVLYVAKQPGEHLGKLVALDESGNQCAVDTVLRVKGFAELTPDYKVDQRTVLVNERVTLQMTLKNGGSAPARNVRATFVLPEGMEFMSARGPIEFENLGNQVRFALMDEVPPGAEKVFHLAVLPKQAGTSKITLKLESEDYSDPIFQDQAIQVIPVGQ